MTDEELVAALRMRAESELCKASANRIEALIKDRDAAINAFLNARHDLWMKTNIHVAALLELEADRETDKSIAAGSRRMNNLADMHGYTARAFRREAKTLRGQLAKKKVPLNFLE
jgi:hypothetical protein